MNVISLTENGAALARRIAELFVNAQHLHRPQPFAASVQQLFHKREPLIMICAMGIAVRSLAPVINNKHDDPPVIVLDEDGRFIVPLLSGHEGGANELASKLANSLGGQCIITGPTKFTQPQYVIGLGCERNCPENFINDLINQHLSMANISADDIVAFASIDIKHDERALLAIAQQWQRPFETFAAKQLNRYENKLTQKSDIVFKEVGCYGVAEAAALCAAEQLTGNPAELVVPKQKNAKATFALARSYLNETDEIK